MTVASLSRLPIRAAAHRQPILPSLTETVCELGACDRLVGVDRYSNYPPVVQKLPQVGGGIDPNVEDDCGAATRRGAHRQVVLARESGWRPWASKWWHWSPKPMPMCSASCSRLGELLEVAKMPSASGAPSMPGYRPRPSRIPASVRGTKVYFEVNQGPYAAGESSFIGETLVRLGVKNIVPAKLGPFPKLNPEFIVRANPDVILIGQRSAVLGCSARAGKAFAPCASSACASFPADEANVLVRPGPRMAEAARLMAKCLED
jgi:iron complex transport system substrate-binding protein